jgi:gliding motility-associated-like protein
MHSSWHIVYNRWGSLVFESNDLYQGWNGEFKGKPCPVGVYVWIAAYESMAVDVPAERKIVKGNVMLLR